MEDKFEYLRNEKSSRCMTKNRREKPTQRRGKKMDAFVMLNRISIQFLIWNKTEPLE